MNEKPPVREDEGMVPFVTSAATAPTVYADAVWFASSLSGVVRMAFVENILEPEGSLAPGIKARHVGNLLMPEKAFDDMIEYLIRRRELFKTMKTESDAT